MMISTKGRYALQIMIDLAQNGNGGPVSLRDVAERQKISMKYLEAIVAMLNKEGFVSSFRGKAGGYVLARNPEEYSMREILELTEGTLAPVSCVDGGCPCEKECLTIPLWQNLDEVIGNYLNGVTLKDIIDGNVKRKTETDEKEEK